MTWFRSRVPRGLVWLWLGVLPVAPLTAGELSRPLRQAEEFLRVGRLEDARAAAISVQKAFPDELAALLLLGRIDFERRDYRTSKLWFQAAARLSPRHPLITLYKTMFREMEHQQGEPISDFGPLSHPDKTESLRSLRRGWFGPNFLNQFSKVPKPAPPAPPPATPSAGILTARSADFAAHEALEKKWYLKAYLLYKDLLRATPDHTAYQLSLAEAAIGMRRMKEAEALVKKILKKDPENLEAMRLLREIPAPD